MSQVAFHPQKLADFISLKRGHDLPESRRIPGEIPVVSSAGITGFHNEAKCEGPGVITGRYGTLGELHYVEGSYWPLNTTLYVDDFKGNAPRFVYYLLQTLDLAQFNGAGAVPGLNRNALAMIDVAVPEPNDQKIIAEQLTSFDLLADNLKRQIEILEEAARLIYTEWFVRLRFPGHVKTKISGSLPDGWRQAALGQRIELNYGKSLKESERQPGEIPVFGSSGIVGSHSGALSHGPGIIVGRKGNVGSIFYSAVPFFAIDTVYFISPEQTTFFLLHTLQRMNFVSSDSTVPGLNRNYAYSQPVIWPSDSVLSEFEVTCTPIYEQITTLEKQIAALKSARDLLLPRLISGQLRL